MSALLVILALVVALLVGVLIGARAAFAFVRQVRPGREGDLLAELAALRASQGLHHAALKTEAELWRTVSGQKETPK